MSSFRVLRALSSAGALTLVLGAHAATGALPPAPPPVSPVAMAQAWGTAADTVPALTRAERRELRRLEREELRARRKRGEPIGDGKRGNGLAIASVATGLLGVALAVPVFLVADAGVFVFFLAAFACALVFGAIALRRANRKGRRHKGLAVAGLVLGIVGVAYSGLLWLARVTSGAG